VLVPHVKNLVVPSKPQVIEKNKIDSDLKFKGLDTVINDSNIPLFQERY